MKRIAAVLLACTATLAPAQTAPAPVVEPEAFRAHVAFLADDLLEGRDTGARGYDIAARYVATQFDALGLKSGGTVGWYQPVPFARARFDAAKPAALSIGGTRFVNGSDVAIAPDGRFPEQALTAGAVFVGYGLDAKDQGLDDYRGLDVRGKIVVLLSGTPAGLPSDVAASLNAGKARSAEARGAVGVITLPTPVSLKLRPWAASIRRAVSPRLDWTGVDGVPRSATPGLQTTLFAHGAAAAALFDGAQQDLATVLKAIAKPGAKPRGFALKPRLTITTTTSVERFASPNVIGVLPGSDPALASEYILLTAHLDHNGVQPDAPGADKTFNGAMDNAAGVATMIEAARAFVVSGVRPKRSVMFVALTAEEDGLLGSDYLARHPAVPSGARVVANVNLDMPVLLYDLKDVIAFGADHSTIGAAVDRAAKASGLALIADPMPEENIFTRSDHYSFVKQGVPSVMLATGFGGGGDVAFRAFLGTHYHKVSDQIDLPFNWAAAAKFAEVNYRIARDLADAAEAPRWYGDSPFAAQFAKGQPMAVRPK